MHHAIGSSRPIAGNGKASLVPGLRAAFEYVHALLQRELSDEVRPPRGGDSDFRFAHLATARAFHDRRPRFELLRLRTIEVAASKHVAKMRVQERAVVLDRQRRRVHPRALERPSIHQERSICDLGVWGEPLQDLLHSGHLRRVPCADERTDDDSLQPSLTDRVQQAHLVIHRYVGGFDLHPFPHRLVPILNHRPLEIHRTPSLHRLGLRTPSSIVESSPSLGGRATTPLPFARQDASTPKIPLPSPPYPPTSFPHSLTSFPHSLTSFPHSLTSFPQPITSFPQPITSFPQPITSFPRRRESHGLHPIRIHRNTCATTNKRNLRKCRHAASSVLWYNSS